jgi:hypothetical protein
MTHWLDSALRRLPAKPSDSDKQALKKAYSEKLSHFLAVALGKELKTRGCTSVRPTSFSAVGSRAKGGSGAERRIAGGIGSKKVDVSWATEESGLVLGISVKTVNFRDAKGHFQKNLTNRRGDLLFESTTLHRRFPFAVLGGLFILDVGATSDGTAKRQTTFLNAHDRLRLFTGRSDIEGREEQFERLYVCVFDASRAKPEEILKFYEAGDPSKDLPHEYVFSNLIHLVAERNPDTYRAERGRLRSR